MRIVGVVLVAALGVLVAAPVEAHPGHEQSPNLRVWKDADGLFEIEASFVLARDGKVQLCKHDGTIVWVPIEKLSRDDQDWVRKRAQDAHDLNAARALPVSSEGPSAVASASSGTTSGGFAVVSVAVVLFLAGFGLLYRRVSSLLPVAALVVGSLSLVAADDTKAVPTAQKHFEPFKDKLELRSDDDYLYVGSNGLPDHPLMIGIRAWQQQVPLPQPYTGKNAWRIPLKPRLSDTPISAKRALFSGAIAVAVNGVPIFNALNNRGEDSYLAGELDEYGGHCGRGDDYHYHMAPVHLEKTVGKGAPIGYALDGFPLYGYTDAEGKEPKNLDEFNGRREKDGYRYYSTKTYPYINGGIRGVVTVRGDRIDPQPRDIPIRPAGQPLRGAKITDFIRDEANKTYTLKYDVGGKILSIQYTINKDGTYTFVYTDAEGKQTTETYRRREGKDRDGPPKKDGKGDRPPPPDDSLPPHEDRDKQLWGPAKPDEE